MEKMRYNKIEPKKMGENMMVSKTEKDKKVYPHFSIDLKHLPEAKKWEIGKTYHLALELEQTGININSYDNSAAFDIKGIKVITNEAPAPAAKSDESKKKVRYA